MSDYFSEMIGKLSAAGIESPRLEAKLILAHILNCESAEISMYDDIPSAVQTKADALLQRRLKHEPLDKILGHRGFYKYDFLTDKRVLSPRPESELLVEEALNLLAPETECNILDLGTGSGCLLASILAQRPCCRGIGIDISADALEVARQNIARLNLQARMDLQQADWFAADFITALAKKFSLIVSNPPYIPTKDIAELAPEVRDYDPLPALDGGEDGMDSYARIAEIAPKLLLNGGYILLEAGYGQAAAIADLFLQQKFSLIKIADDLSGIQRCVIMQKSVA